MRIPVDQSNGSGVAQAATQPGTPGLARENIRVIAALETAALRNRSNTARTSDAVSRFAASAPFIFLHILWFASWLLINLGKVPGIKPFDPYPFIFLTLIVSLEAIFLSIFVLISENHMSHQADRRAHLDLQINLLAEQENTMMLSMLRRLCEKQGIPLEDLGDDGPSLFGKTDLKALVQDLEKYLPET